MKKHLIAITLSTIVISANAALVCTEVTRPNGTTSLACKNVPDAPTGPQGTPLPKPPGTAPVRPNAVPPPSNAEAAQPPVDHSPAVAEQPESISKKTYSGIAQAASLQMLMPSDGKSTLNLSGATFGGQSAIGLTFAHRTQSLVFSAGAAFGSSGKSLVRVGAGMEF